MTAYCQALSLRAHCHASTLSLRGALATKQSPWDRFVILFLAMTGGVIASALSCERIVMRAHCHASTLSLRGALATKQSPWDRFVIPFLAMTVGVIAPVIANLVKQSPWDRFVILFLAMTGWWDCFGPSGLAMTELASQ